MSEMTTKLELASVSALLDKTIIEAQKEINRLTEDFILEHGYWPMVQTSFDEETNIITFKLVHPYRTD